ncbi:MAG: putative lipid II flippase FtsW [Ruminococcaceae bacterium]|nr:putative lipid II flippase FtsW [Oscillospiraceae bacterium]
MTPNEQKNNAGKTAAQAQRSPRPQSAPSSGAQKSAVKTAPKTSEQKGSVKKAEPKKKEKPIKIKKAKEKKPSLSKEFRESKEKKVFLGNIRSAKPLDTVYRVKSGVDSTFLIIVLALLCFGTVMVFSSSYFFAGSRFNNSTFFVKRQTLYALAGVAALIFFSFFDYRLLRNWALPIFGVSYILMFCVFLPVIGKSEKGATRWIDLKIITLQPSDIMKFSIVLILALYFSCVINKTKKFKYGIFFPACILLAVCFSTIIQKHISGTVIIFLIGAVMILISGASAKWLAGICAAGASAVCAIIFFTNYATARVNAWLHPETVLQDGGWQPYQSMLAIGSGGIFGVGLGNSYQKQSWLPEPQNDFIFAIVCEELGLIGGLCVIALFIALVWRGLSIAKKAPDTFSSLLVTGLVAKVGIQALLNIAVVTATIPTTGIALPFFSYGGTALIMQLAEMGIVLSVSRYSSQEKI